MVTPSAEQLARLSRIASAYRALGQQTWSIHNEFMREGLSLSTGTLGCLRLADAVADELFLLLRLDSASQP